MIMLAGFTIAVSVSAIIGVANKQDSIATGFGFLILMFPVLYLMGY